MKIKSGLLQRVILMVIVCLTACSVPAALEATVAPVLPSNTPIPPTATPVPTDTPVPTATPTATPTDTPVPFSLSVVISDASGKAIQGAEVVVLEQKDNPQTTNASGEVTWDSLPVETVSLNIRANGYKVTDKKVSMRRGMNKEAISLETDQWGALSSQACKAGEKLLYFEDLQDQHADNWPEIETGSRGWSVVEVPNEPGNYAILAQGSPDVPVAQTHLKSDQVFDNAVWRVKVYFLGRKAQVSTFLNWRQSFENGDGRYSTHFGPQVFVDLTRFVSGEGVPAGHGGSNVPLNKWYSFEISTYKGVTEIWKDGKEMVSYTDKDPLPPGTIGLEPHFDAEGSIYYDNLAVCELSAPFTTIITATATPAPKKK
jgi:hypothetical protein